MYNFDKLARKCKLYYFKKIFYISIAISLLVAISTYLFFHTPVEKKVPTLKIVKKTLLPIQNISKKQQIIPKKSLQKNNYCYALQFFVSKKGRTHYIELNKEKLTQLGFDCSIYAGTELLHLICNKTRDYSKFLNAKKLANHYNLTFVEKKRLCSDEKKQAKKPKLEPKEVQKEVSQPKSEFTLQSKEYNLDILKELFNKRKNYNLAFKIAQYYYNAKNYDNAIKWAKKANNIDKTDDASWILYAKALYAKKEYKKAKEILQIYAQFENSTKVNTLLSDWSNR